jgi:hypothetical protein
MIPAIDPRWTRADRRVIHDIQRRDAMSNPLDSLPATIGLGFVLTVILYLVVKALV